jgi:hypothetical protein
LATIRKIGGKPREDERRKFVVLAPKEDFMMDINQIKPNAEVIGADGVHVGTVDHVDGRRLKLTRRDSRDARRHFIDGGLIADIENGRVRLSANADVAVTLEDDISAPSGRSARSSPSL